MKFKRLLAFVISMSLVVGSVQSLVLANEVGFSADDTEVAETTVAPKEESESKDKKSSESDGEKKSKTEEKKPEPEEEKVSESKEDKQPEVKDEKEPEAKAEEPEVKEDKEPETKEENPEVKEDKEPEASAEEPETDEEQTPETEKTPETDKVQQSGVVRTAKKPEIKSKSSNSDENDKLFNNYVDRLLYPDRYAARKAASVAGSRLSGPEKMLYDALKPHISKLANGTISDTFTIVTVNNTGFENVYFTRSELGVSSFLDGDYLSTEVTTAINDKIKIDYSSVHNALLFDSPSELYWYDKTAGVYFLPRAIISEDGESLCYSGKIDVYFSVADAYRGSDLFMVNTGKIKTVKTSISNAKKVVENAKSKRDYDKLAYYRDYICSQVEYNTPAVSTPTAYGNPWQLIWVFDNNRSTDVVCEGYSKAFKYLCDLSTFNNPNITCLLVTGDMADGELAPEPHMWNIVQFGDNKNFLVDVTNSDMGLTAHDFVFLTGYSSGSVDAGYIRSFDANTIDGYKHIVWKYYYDENTLKSYSKQQLTLCKYNYSSSNNYSGTYGNFSWSVDYTGVLKITGNGAIDNFTPDSPAPWMAYGNIIETVVLSGKITSIGNYAFSGCPILKYVTIPGSVTSIGSYAFYGCPNLSKISGGSNVRMIGTYAFAKCPKLSSFNIKSSKLKKIGSFAFSGDGKLKTIYIQKTTKLTKSGVKRSLKGSSVKTVKVKKSKVKKYKKYFKKSNSGRSVKVKK